ncbi:hypothetical protein OG819_08160 [Streptomyces sp. NBC_01549]|nr:hypothetical protein [Streptomyces sp. NBC_01549]MCX4589730.1 hypothetical protein [Streptomyces sp. NBC_01549]
MRSSAGRGAVRDALAAAVALSAVALSTRTETTAVRTESRCAP